MSLTPQEVEDITREHLLTLEQEEARRQLEKQQALAMVNSSAVVGEDIAERERREREEDTRKLKLKLEEKFYSERGYLRYVNHKGRVLWLTPEQYALRTERRRRNRRRSGALSVRRQFEQIAVYLVITAIALVIGLYIAK